MVNKFVQNVETLCKNTRKTMCKSRVNFCVQILFSKLLRVKLSFSTHFSHLSHTLSHSHPPLVFNYFIHYSTAPTITTTK